MIAQQIDIKKLGETAAYDEFGKPVRLADLWHDQTAVLVFVRHFG